MKKHQPEASEGPINNKFRSGRKPDALREQVETIFTEEQMQDENAQAMLSQREREVILLAVEGLTTAEIAHTLRVSPSTIKAHLLKIYRKSGVKRRIQLVKLAEALWVDKGPMNADCALYREEAFQELIHSEAVRSSRSGRFPLLLLFHVSVWESTEMTQKIISVLSSSTRETDVKGWYADGAIMGILFTEFGRMHNTVDAAREAIIGRLYGSLSGILSNEDILRMKITPYSLSREAVASSAPDAGNRRIQEQKINLLFRPEGITLELSERL